MDTLDTVAIVGLGYVGLPLAVAFGRQRKTIGLDLNEEKLVALAKELKLDMAQFESDRQSEVIADQVDKDLAQAKIHKFSATPMFLVNGVVVRGAQSSEYFTEVIERLLAEKKGQ